MDDFSVTELERIEQWYRMSIPSAFSGYYRSLELEDVELAKRINETIELRKLKQQPETDEKYRERLRHHLKILFVHHGNSMRLLDYVDAVLAAGEELDCIGKLVDFPRMGKKEVV